MAQVEQLYLQKQKYSPIKFLYQYEIRFQQKLYIFQDEVFCISKLYLGNLAIVWSQRKHTRYFLDPEQVKFYCSHNLVAFVQQITFYQTTFPLSGKVQFLFPQLTKNTGELIGREEFF